MIWQRSVVAKEKVRTIEVNDYGCKNICGLKRKEPNPEYMCLPKK